MRKYEILKYLSTSYDYIDLGSFIKKKYPHANSDELLYFLKGLYHGQLKRGDNLIEIKGNEWELLGKNYVDIEDWGKCELIGLENAKIAGKGVIGRGVGSVENLKIEARITDLGRTALEQRESGFFLGIKISTLTLIISLVSLAISIMALVFGK